MAYRVAYPNVVSDEDERSFSSESEDYEYQIRMMTRETRLPRDIVRAPTPPPIIKRVVERAPTPESPLMERVIIRPQAQEIVERVIEQPCTPRPIVRTRIIRVNRPVQCGSSQPSSSYGHLGTLYRAPSIAGSVGRPAMNCPSISTFEYMPPQPLMIPVLQQQHMMYQRVPSYMYPAPQHFIPFGYQRMVRMPMFSFPMNPMVQQLVY